MRANRMWNPETIAQLEELRCQHDEARGHGRGGHPRPGGDRRQRRAEGFGPGFGPGFGGPPPWIAQLLGAGFGPGAGQGGPRGRGRGPRVRRGDVRSAILDVVAGSESEINGYQLIQQIAEKSDGVWRPSPGSVYPTIAQLEDEGLLETVTGENGKKVLHLTDEGRTYVAEHADELAAVWRPFEQPQDDGDHANLKQVIGQTMAAVWQVASSGTPAQQERAAAILAETRRKLYGLLADGPEDE